MPPNKALESDVTLAKNAKARYAVQLYRCNAS
jgi:hypothetical protein